MKIFKDGVEVAALPDTPHNFDGGCKGNTIFITVGDETIKLATYSTFERAREVCGALAWAYIKDNADSFTLPEA